MIDCHHARWGLVIASRNSVCLVSKLDAGNVVKVQDRAVRIGAENDVSKFFRLDQASLRADGIGELLALRNRLAANLAGGVHIVLGLDR